MYQKSKVFIFLQNNYQYLILGLLCLFVIISNVMWLAKDNSLVENRDSKIYLENTIEFIQFAKSPDFNLLDGILKLSHDGRPVVLQLSSIPFLLIFGNSFDAYTYFNFWFYVLLIVSTYKIGRVVKDRNVGLMAAILVAFYPPVIRLSKIPLTSFAVIACTALTTWLLLEFMHSRSVKHAWYVNLSLAFGLLVHPSIAWGIAIPTAILMLYTVFFSTQPRWVSSPSEIFPWLGEKLRQPVFLRGLFPAALISIGAILAWYLGAGMSLVTELQGIDSWAPESGHYFLGPAYSNFPYELWYVVSSGFAISTLLALLFWGIMIFANIKYRSDIFPLSFLFLGSYLGHALLLYGAGWRYFSQTLPIMAAITAIGIYAVKPRILATSLAIVSIAISAFNFYVVSWGPSVINQSIAGWMGIGDPAESDYCRPSFGFYCPDPPDLEVWPVKELVGTILADPACAAGECEVLVLPADVYFYEALPISLVFDFADASLDVGFLLDPGVWGINVGRPLNGFDIPRLLESNYIVYNIPTIIADNISPASVERYQAMKSFFESPPLSFSSSHQIVSEYQFPNGTKGVLYKRTLPLTLTEAEETVAAINLPESEKVRKYGLFFRLSKSDADTAKWLSTLQNEIGTAPRPEPYHSLLIELGDYYQFSEQAEAALKAYAQALDVDPKDDFAHVSMARVFLSLDDCESAIPHLQESVRLRPTIARRYVILGDAYRMCDRMDEAILSYQIGIEKDPRDVLARQGLGLSFALVNEFEKARAEFEMVIQLAPGTPYAERANAWLVSNADKFK